ncbi:MAG: XRE family transcriptional regulator [Rhodocyclaceae bacterium]|nr:MAG: XRE family transcriptional regulator [Rhodocyclaceae bacterium]
MSRHLMRAARAERGISQEKLAELTGTSQSSITRFETGATMPPADVALKIAQALGLTIEQLLEVEAPAPVAEAS